MGRVQSDTEAPVNEQGSEGDLQWATDGVIISPVVDFLLLFALTAVSAISLVILF